MYHLLEQSYNIIYQVPFFSDSWVVDFVWIHSGPNVLFRNLGGMVCWIPHIFWTFLVFQALFFLLEHQVDKLSLRDS